MRINLHLTSTDENHESLKKNFNLLTLLPLQTHQSDEYKSAMHSSRNAEVEVMLEQPSEKVPVSSRTCSSKEDRKRWKKSSHLLQIPFVLVAFGFRWPNVTKTLILLFSNFSFRWRMCFRLQLIASLMGSSKQVGTNNCLTLLSLICLTFSLYSSHTLNFRK